MGKDSLIKSTTKKSGGKKGSKKAPPGKAAKIPNAKEGPKLTGKDLLFKQFVERQAPSALPLPDYSNMTAPAFIDSIDPAETDRLRSLLSKRFDMQDIHAAAQAPAHSPEDETFEADQAVGASESQQAEKLQREPAPMADQIAQVPPIDQVRPEQMPEQPSTPADASVPQPDAETPEPTPMADQIAQVPPIDQVRPEQMPEQPSTPANTSVPQSDDKKPEPAPMADQNTRAPHPTAAHASTGGGDDGSYPPAGTVGRDPVQRFAIMGGLVLALLLILIIWASISNSFRFFVVPTSASVEIWRGDFSPAGRQFLAVLHGVRPDAPLKASYRRQEVYPMIFSYYIERADGLLEVDGLPDFQAANEYLLRAERFAIDNDMRKAVATRSQNIQRLLFLYKADLDTSRGTAESLQSALQNLRQARQLTSDPSLLQIIDQRIALVSKNIAALKAEPKPAK